METIQTMRFEEKTEKKIVNALKKIFDLEDNPISDEKALEKELFRLDVSNVCMVEAKTPESKVVLAKFIDVDWKCNFNLPKMEFWESKEIEVVSKYSEDYVKRIINLLCATETDLGSIEIKMKNNYPAQFSNKHWRIILAPRVEQD